MPREDPRHCTPQSRATQRKATGFPKEKEPEVGKNFRFQVLEAPYFVQKRKQIPKHLPLHELDRFVEVDGVGITVA